MLVGLQSASGSWGGSPVSSCQHWLWTGDLSSCHCCGVLRLSCLSQSSQCRTPSSGSDSCHTPCCTHRQWPVYRYAQQSSWLPHQAPSWKISGSSLSFGFHISPKFTKLDVALFPENWEKCTLLNLALSGLSKFFIIHSLHFIIRLIHNEETILFTQVYVYAKALLKVGHMMSRCNLLPLVSSFGYY